MEIKLLIDRLKIKQVYGHTNREVTHITTDSRQVKKGSIFVASKGNRVDSHNFIEDVINKGVEVIVVERFVEVSDDITVILVNDSLRVASLFAHMLYEYPTNHLTTVGITGTNGKTTIATMLHHLWQHLGLNSSYIGTNGFMLNANHYETKNTTPETVTLTEHIHEAVDFGADVMNFEVSSHGLMIGRLNGVEFDIAIFTNLTQDHLDFHGSMTDYKYAKERLFTGLGQDLSKEKYVILNGDDPVSELYRTSSPYEVITYGLQSHHDIYADHIKESIEGTTFRLVTPTGQYNVTSPYIGLFNVSNLIAAMTACWVKGYSFEQIIQTIDQLERVSGRLEVLDDSLPIQLVIDFAHTPDGLQKVIESVKPLVQNKLIVLTGMQGERDTTKAFDMGRIACLGDVAIYTPDNPVDDDPDYLTGLLKAGATHDNIYEFSDRSRGVEFAIEISEPGDTILLTGKGREPYQIGPGGVKHPYREDEIALNAAYKKYGVMDREN
ncbi:UDP-N-acetylmuramoyl-L-alanyl-D-glutamate--2,6-diaminopimelate ligase [Abyssicoccus albus]|uniref:UDP-N-acetylmuramoyl-L-alanyl-D-glutamate--2, 6-diaminopimelate ligase n=1 Tax=Abyssicoccus albus TaxID=1817405 RepID=UPI00097E33A1|nr:UDP-N-acetylmuramoyl-L-alanyl-D-glutamate--2,6-diaminopimelate ligase [Abyssicoccus albus]AQL56554.1 UDP-N-acetylmuramoyl-L-alanyl-D-glutamate--2,6-diaminopimelate ligase [Abyssicoccus albus]